MNKQAIERDFEKFFEKKGLSCISVAVGDVDFGKDTDDKSSLVLYLEPMLRAQHKQSDYVTVEFTGSARYSMDDVDVYYKNPSSFLDAVGCFITGVLGFDEIIDGLIEIYAKHYTAYHERRGTW